MLKEGKRYSDIAHFACDEMFLHSLDPLLPFTVDSEGPKSGKAAFLTMTVVGTLQSKLRAVAVVPRSYANTALIAAERTDEAFSIPGLVGSRLIS